MIPLNLPKVFSLKVFRDTANIMQSIPETFSSVKETSTSGGVSGGNHRQTQGWAYGLPPLSEILLCSRDNSI